MQHTLVVRQSAQWGEHTPRDFNIGPRGRGKTVANLHGLSSLSRHTGKYFEGAQAGPAFGAKHLAVGLQRGLRIQDSASAAPSSTLSKRQTKCCSRRQRQCQSQRGRHQCHDRSAKLFPRPLQLDLGKRRQLNRIDRDAYEPGFPR